MTPDDLRAFTAEIAALYDAAKIPHPVHLSDGNEFALIELFKDIRPNDWVCGSWRFSTQALLKGVPCAELKQAIMTGRSISLCFEKQRVVCSAIVGGILPIAVGIAMGIKRAGGTERVHCWVGDMTAETGIFHECSKYAANFDLPVRWLVESNGLSVCTPTVEAWGKDKPVRRTCYEYKSRFPHAGAGRRIMF